MKKKSLMEQQDLFLDAFFVSDLYFDYEFV